MLEWDQQSIRWNGQAFSVADLEGFHERWDPWRGRPWLLVRGPGWSVPMNADYGELRRRLRKSFGELPFSSDWGNGEFPAVPWGWPGLPVWWAGTVLWVVLTCIGLWWGGDLWAAAIWVAGTWPVARLRDRALVGKTGLSLGPPWLWPVPWDRVQAVYALPRGRMTRVWAKTATSHGMAVDVPTILMPAFRARVRRLGGLVVEDGGSPLDERYERWRGAAAGVPWGVLVATVATAWFTPFPWAVCTIGLLIVAATAMLSAAIEARATGWGFGGVFWFTGVYGVVLAAVAVGAHAF